MKFSRAFHDFAENTAAQLEKGRHFYLICFSIVFLGFTALRALNKPFWSDELYTYYISRLPGIDTIWSALKDGADLNPPLLYVATRVSLRAFGDGPVAARLPEILGFLTMLLCVYRLVAVRCGSGYGFIALLLAAISGAYAYAYEARSYGMVLGFGALSFVCWQSAAEGRARRITLPGLTLSLGAALASHCYAALLVVPLGLGELVRSIRKKHVDWAVWIALLLASSMVLVYLPLLASNRNFAFDNVTFRPTLRVLAESYSILLHPLVWPAIAALVVIVVSRQPQEAQERNLAGPAGFLPHEITAAAGFLLVPVFAFLTGRFISHVFMTRYGLAAIIGFCVLFVAFIHRYADNRRVASAILPVLFAGWFVAGFFVWMAGATRGNTAAAAAGSPQHVYELSPEAVEPGLPFVASNGLFFLEADHYAPPSFRSRLVYLTDRHAAIRYTGSDVFERGLPTFKKWFPIQAHIEDYATFVREHRRFLVFGGFDHPLGWVTKKLLDDGARLRFLGQYHGAYGENLLLEADLPTVEPVLPPK